MRTIPSDFTVARPAEPAAMAAGSLAIVRTWPLAHKPPHPAHETSAGRPKSVHGRPLAEERPFGRLDDSDSQWTDQPPKAPRGGPELASQAQGEVGELA